MRFPVKYEFNKETVPCRCMNILALNAGQSLKNLFFHTVNYTVQKNAQTASTTRRNGLFQALRLLVEENPLTLHHRQLVEAAARDSHEPPEIMAGSRERLLNTYLNMMKIKVIMRQRT